MLLSNTPPNLFDVLSCSLSTVLALAQWRFKFSGRQSEKPDSLDGGQPDDPERMLSKAKAQLENLEKILGRLSEREIAEIEECMDSHLNSPSIDELRGMCTLEMRKLLVSEEKVFWAAKRDHWAFDANLRAELIAQIKRVDALSADVYATTNRPEKLRQRTQARQIAERELAQSTVMLEDMSAIDIRHVGSPASALGVAPELRFPELAIIHSHSSPLTDRNPSAAVSSLSVASTLRTLVGVGTIVDDEGENMA